MARIVAENTWSPVDDAPGRNLRSPRSSHIAAAIRALNHISGHNRRIVFCQHYTDAAVSPSTPATPTAADPMTRFRYSQTFAGGRRLDHRALVFPPFTAEPAAGTATPTIWSDKDPASAASSSTMYVIGAVTEPGTLRQIQWNDNNVAPIASAYANRRIGASGSVKLDALAIYETSDQPGRILDTSWGTSIDPFRAPRPGGVIVDDLPTDLRTLEETLWTTQRQQQLTVHGWIYGLADGLMRDLGFTVHRAEDLLPSYVAALEALET